MCRRRERERVDVRECVDVERECVCVDVERESVCVDVERERVCVCVCRRRERE